MGENVVWSAFELFSPDGAPYEKEAYDFNFLHEYFFARLTGLFMPSLDDEAAAFKFQHLGRLLVHKDWHTRLYEYDAVQAMNLPNMPKQRKMMLIIGGEDHSDMSVPEMLEIRGCSLGIRAISDILIRHRKEIEQHYTKLKQAELNQSIEVECEKIS
jgi:hypothetical protein